jgi:hypothetical protein
MARDPVDLVHKGRDLDLDLHAVFLRVDAVGGLDRELAEPLQDILALLEVTFGCLDEGDAVGGVARGLVQAADLGPHLFGNGEAGCVIARSVDAQSGTELFHVAGDPIVGDSKLPVGEHGAEIVIDDHMYPPWICVRSILAPSVSASTLETETFPVQGKIPIARPRYMKNRLRFSA